MCGHVLSICAIIYLVDVWDGNDNDPVVTHGYAGTTKLLFSDVIEAIDDAAFYSSKFVNVPHLYAFKQVLLFYVSKDCFFLKYCMQMFLNFH